MLASIHTSRALRRLLTVLLSTALTTAFVACGGSSGNGVASKSANQILAASKAAAASATSVHLATTTGEVVLDVNLSRTGATGRLTLSGKTLEITRVGNTIYLKANPTVYKALGITAKVPSNAWLKASASQAGQLAAFTEMSGETTRLLNLEGPLTKGPTTTVNGQKVVELKQAKKIYTRSLYVATTGKPYPIEILLRGQVTGKTTFSDWNKPVTPTAPANSVDISQLQRAGH
jgi:hypothetical protein